MPPFLSSTSYQTPRSSLFVFRKDPVNAVLSILSNYLIPFLVFHVRNHEQLCHPAEYFLDAIVASRDHVHYGVEVPFHANCTICARLSTVAKNPLLQNSRQV